MITLKLAVFGLLLLNLLFFGFSIVLKAYAFAPFLNQAYSNATSQLNSLHNGSSNNVTSNHQNNTSNVPHVNSTTIR